MGKLRDVEGGAAGRDDPASRGAELRNMFSRARAFTEELLQENERLRLRVAGLTRELEQRAAASPAAEVARLTEQVRALQVERDDLLNRFQQVEATNREVAARYEEIETQNSQIANLYVASYQLHATLNFTEVLDTIREILINLIGAEAFAVYWVDERSGVLRREASQGMDASIPEVVRCEEGPLRQAAGGGESYYADPLPDPRRVDLSHPIACIPLLIDARTIGVIAIYRLLQQKNRFSPVDFEIFSLLGGHAATALFSSRLYQRSERKLSNLQGFLDMLTAPNP